MYKLHINPVFYSKYSIAELSQHPVVLVCELGGKGNEMADTAEDFINRIRETLDLASEHRYPLHAIPGLVSTLTQQHIVNIHTQILQNEHLKEQIHNLKPGQEIYIKRNNKDPRYRSYCITCTEDGTYRLDIQPKAKMWDNMKRIAAWFTGSYKTMKLDVRTDLPRPEWSASCIVKIKHDEEGSKLKQEIIDEYKTQQYLSMQQNSKIAIPISCSIRENQADAKMGSCTKVILRSKLYEESLLDFVNRLYDLKISDQEQLEGHLADIILQIMDGIAGIHKAGMAHRDIKPENIFLEFDQEMNRYMVAIGDCGFAKNLNTMYRPQGTPGFVPEWWYNVNLENPMKIDHTHDIYSMGIIITEVLQLVPILHKKMLPVVKRFSPKSEGSQPDINTAMELLAKSELGTIKNKFIGKSPEQRSRIQTKSTNVDKLRSPLAILEHMCPDGIEPTANTTGYIQILYTILLPQNKSRSMQQLKNRTIDLLTNNLNLEALRAQAQYLESMQNQKTTRPYAEKLFTACLLYSLYYKIDNFNPESSYSSILSWCFDCFKKEREIVPEEPVSDKMDALMLVIKDLNDIWQNAEEFQANYNDPIKVKNYREPKSR